MRLKQNLIVLFLLLTLLVGCVSQQATSTSGTVATNAPAEPASAPTESAPTDTAAATTPPTEVVPTATTQVAATSEATVEPTPEATSEATTQATSEAMTAETSVVAEVTSCPEGQRLFDHEVLATGALCIPENPQRVVALDMAAIETLLLKNQPPVGTATWILEELPLLLPQYAETLGAIEGLGYPAELEKVAVLKPDLILAPSDTIDVALASEIAPVITPDATIYNDWKIGMRFWSDVLNIPDSYTKMEENYRTRVAELKTAIGEPSSIKISVISASTYGFSLWMPDSPPGAILNDVGLARPEAQSLVGQDAKDRYGEQQYIQITEERLDLADGDAIFFFTYAATNPEVAASESAFIESFQKKPIWQTLNAVRAGKSYFVPGYWWRSQTYLLSNLVIDDLFKHLTDTTATTPVLSSVQ